jgi:DNA helicase II / ATP-dependent DNA helicase PcrA
MEFDSAFDSSLNEQQRAAVSQIEGPILILAGPGSGKTRVITQRIAHLIDNDIPSQNIAALTFTNKAAQEMKKRLDKIVPGNFSWTGTFHRFCSRLLRRYASMVGLRENFSIFDTDDTKKLLKQSIASSKIDLRHYTPERVAGEISKIKNAGITHEQFQGRPGHYFDTIIGRVYPEYQKLLKLSNGADFDDLLLHVVDLLRQSPELRETLDRHYAFMLVDEYQDTNSAQYQIIRLLNTDQQNLTATGDPDQSIYGWRGANLNNILYFEQDYPDASVYRLEQNYRSTKAILAVADQLISNNVRRKKKTLFTDNEDGNPVRLVSYPKPEEEAADIVNTIAVAMNRQTRRASDYAILYRTNYLSRVLEHAFRRRGIPFKILRGFEFYQRKEVKDLLGYLQLINNPADGVAFARVINVPPRKIGNTTLKRLQEYASENQLSLLEAAAQSDRVPGISKAPQSKLKHFVEMMERLSRLADRDVPSLMQLVLTETGYREWLIDAQDEESIERASNIDELITAAEEFERDYGSDGGLEKYLEQAALVSDTDAWDPDAEYVTMMSLHAAKGLEFACVFIIGLEEGILPHERNNVDEEKVEEERRLFFVGLTRAKTDLQISRCLTRFRRGNSWPSIPSRFLMELPRQDMQIVEPRSFGYHSKDEWGDAIEGLDPFMNDGLPTYDIHQDDYQDSPDVSKTSFPSEPKLYCDDDSGFDRFEFLDDQVQEVSPKYQTLRKPVPETVNYEPEVDLNETDSEFVVGKKLPKFPRLVTAAQLAQQQTAESSVYLHPSCYQVGMAVAHDEYGNGVIVSLLGEGTKRMATIDFSGRGMKRFHLAFAKLKAAEPPLKG